MKLKDILSRQAVCGNLKTSDKKAVLEELAQVAVRVVPTLTVPEIVRILTEREKLGSTGVGNGVAIPHGKMAGLKSMVVIFGRSKKGIEFNSHDHKPANLFFVLLAPEDVVGNHLQALARLSRLLKGDIIRARLLEEPDDQLYDLLIKEDDQI